MDNQSTVYSRTATSSHPDHQQFWAGLKAYPEVLPMVTTEDTRVNRSKEEDVKLIAGV